MALFAAAIRRDSVSLLRFLFLSHVQVISCEILLVCHTYSCFSSHFCSIDLMSRVFANGQGDQGSIQGRVIPKMVLDAALLNTQYYKVRIKGKVEQSMEWSIALSNT